MAANGAGGVKWYEIVTAAVALWGAGLSTYHLWVSGRERLRQVRVTTSWAVVEHASTGNTEPCIYVEAVNTGRRPVTLSNPWLDIAGRGRVFNPYWDSEVSFPHELTEGRKCAVSIPAKNLAATLEREGIAGEVEAVAMFSDATGGIYRSNPMKLSATALRRVAQS